MDFKNKTAVITGGSRGIGLAIAKKLAKGGANIAVLYVGDESEGAAAKAELEQYGTKVEQYFCDVSDFEKSKVVSEQVIEEFGKVDILINNAGITRDKLVLNMEESDFDAVINVNLKGTFNMIRHCTPVFMKQRSGCIVNVSSVSGLIGNPGQANYSTSKAGVVGLTKSTAKELVGRGVRCNAVAPGFIATDMTANLSKNNKLVDMIPMKRMGTAEEVADLIFFLASDAASYITGEVIKVDGGIAM